MRESAPRSSLSRFSRVSRASRFIIQADHASFCVHCESLRVSELKTVEISCVIWIRQRCFSHFSGKQEFHIEDDITRLIWQDTVLILRLNDITLFPSRTKLRTQSFCHTVINFHHFIGLCTLTSNIGHSPIAMPVYF